MSRHPIAQEYQWSILKEYEYWTLLLYEKPTPFLGRAVVWLARDGDMQRYSELTIAELTELKQVILEYETVLANLWKPDHMNYMWLGNFFHEHAGHGHMHLFPRYKEPREFDGVDFIDTRYGAFHFPYENPQFSRKQMEKVCDVIKEQFKNI